jgi:Leucine-rich repeat (LRR) protein
METTHQRALNKFGEQNQKDMAIEEMSELTQALMKERRGRKSSFGSVNDSIPRMEIMGAD